MVERHLQTGVPSRGGESAAGTSLLLGTVAGLSAIAGAHAADLPGKAAPAEYVRVCDTYGAGFFFIPGTDTCLRIGGFVRVDYLLNQGGTNVASGTSPSGLLQASTAFENNYGVAVRTTANLDARSNTEYGLLRSFGQFSVYRAPVSGSFSSNMNFQSGVSASQRQSNVLLERAFIQFAGFTFGYTASFFNFYQSDLSLARLFGATATSSTVLAYTASFGSGFSATVSLEESQYRRAGNSDYLLSNTAGINPGETGIWSSTARPLSGAYGVTYGVQKLPDIVANLRIDQGWGSAQLMGALHQITDYGSGCTNAAATQCFSYSGYNFGRGTSLTGTNGAAFRAGDKWGWAVGAGLRLNLDVISRGDQLWLQAVYTDGAIDYAFGTANQGGDRNSISGAGNLFQFAGTTVQYRDAYVAGAGAAGSSLRTSTAWSISGGFRHFWTPNVRSAIVGGYSSVAVPAIAQSLPGAFVGNFKYAQIGVNTIWSPVRNLDLGLEVMYHNLNSRSNNTTAPVGTGNPAVAAANGCPLVGGVAKCTDQAWTATFRAQRNF